MKSWLYLFMFLFTTGHYGMSVLWIKTLILGSVLSDNVVIYGYNSLVTPVENCAAL